MAHPVIAGSDPQSPEHLDNAGRLRVGARNDKVRELYAPIWKKALDTAPFLV